MLTLLKRIVLMSAAAVLVAVSWPAMPARADLSGCGADTNVHTMAPNDTTDIQFTVQNTDVSPVSWMRVIVPTSDYAIYSTSISGWNDQTSGGSTSTFLTGGSINPGDSLTFTIRVQAANTTSSPSNWVVLASDNSNGDAAIGCNGVFDMEIAGVVSVPLGISDISIADLSPTGVTVKWNTTSAATSQVNYGPDTSYGQSTAVNNNLVTAHSVHVGGLSPNTVYHYQVVSTTSSENLSSDDNTLLTPVVTYANSASPISGGGGVSTGTGVVTTATGKPTEAVPPSIAWTTKLAVSYREAPALSGTAADNDAVARVDYSVDGGKNWLPADNVAYSKVTTTTGKGKKAQTVTSFDGKNVTFSFTPVLVEEGNYIVLARATDPSGNQATTPPLTLVIDRLPPRFGASTVTIGPQMITPNKHGLLVLPAGIDFTMTLGLVGGATTAAVRAQDDTTVHTHPDQSFSLRRSPDTGAWSATLSFTRAGRYQLVGEGVDGVGNQGKRVLATVEVVAPVQVDGRAGALKQATVSLYYLNPVTYKWSLWDGGDYGETNPTPLDDKHRFSLLVPPGQYYVRLKAAGQPDTLTRRFTLTQPTPLSGTLKQQTGPWGWLWTPPVAAPLDQPGAGSVAVAAGINGKLPLVKLATTSGKAVTPVDWYGKPTVLVTMTTWAPQAAEQLPALNKLAGNEDINVVPLAQQQRAETMAAYLRIAGSEFEGVADGDGLLSDVLSAPGVPVLYFIDRRGIIKKVMVGTQSANVILAELSHL